MARLAGSAVDVLVVEDNSLNVLVLETILKKAGHRVHVVSNGRSALSYLATTRCDLVLMDISMPQLDGLETTRQIRRGAGVLDPDVPVIAVSGHSGDEDLQRIKDAGMTGHIEKPFSSDSVLEALEAALHRSREER
jgi:two-component system, OmpR family, sensor histidine kinase TorS